MKNKSPAIDYTTYKSIRYLNLFRLLLSFFFFSIIYKEVGGFVGMKYTHDIAQFIAGFYLAFSILMWIVSVFNKTHSTTIGLAALVVDLPFIISLTLLFGGINNGWVILAVITIGSFSMISHRSWSIIAMPIIAVALLFLLPKLLGLDYSSMKFSNYLLYALTYFAIAFVGISQSQSYNQSLLLTKLQKKKITDLSKLNRMIISQMQAGVVAFDEAYRVVLINNNAKKIIKTKAGQCLPQTVIKAIKTLPILTSKNISVFGEDILVHIEKIGENSETSLLFFELQAQINEKAQQVNLATIGQLSATIAHELRNPMAAIYSAAQLLQESESINSEDIELTEIITKQIERSNRIIEDILLMSKPHVANKITINLHDKLTTFKENFCQQQSVSADCIEIEEFEKPISINFDGSHLSQLLWNLSENALKHGKENKVTIAVHSQTNGVLLDFKNKGDEFEAIVEESLFTPFFTTHTQGTGLGLYICREMCKSNKAKLEYLWQNFEHVFRIHIK